MKKYIILFVLFSTSPQLIFAETPVMISQSQTMNEIVLDGKWSFLEEWKNSSDYLIQYESGEILHFRSAHQGDYVFFMINFLSDTTLNEDLDEAKICLSPIHENNSKSHLKSYCFVSVIGNEPSYILKQNSIDKENFEKVISEPNYVAVANISDENDRYSKTPHLTHEFKIPTSLIERTSEYNLYVGVYDSDSNKLFNWPKNIPVTNPSEIPTLSLWGTMISPDKTLPEFNLPFIILIILLSSIIILQKKFKMNINFQQ